FKKYKYSDKPNLKNHAAISRAAAEEGMVLLKNDNTVLPLNKSIHNIALFGNDSYELIAGGTGSGDVNKAYSVSLAQGLSNLGLNVDTETKNIYTEYIKAE